jgi:hypothetical protein
MLLEWMHLGGRYHPKGLGTVDIVGTPVQPSTWSAVKRQFE